MEDSGNDDVFRDFESKLGHKPPKDTEYDPKQDKTKSKFHDEKQALKEEYKRKMRALKEKKENVVKIEKAPSKPVYNAERLTYIAIIIILLGYLAYDLSFSDNDAVVEEGIEQDITATVINEENKTVDTEAKKEELKVDEVKDGPKLSGTITITIDDIITSVDENIEDLGEIDRILFTINNGKNKILVPVVEVFAYDDDNKEDYETRSRGIYKYAAGIAPGKIQAGSISLSPKKFRNLDLIKNVRLALNSTEDGFITALNQPVTIS